MTGAAAAAVVLAGGRSARMGRSKATLDWHGSTLVRRAVGIVARSVDGPLVVVRAAGQALPALPDAVEIVEDERAGRGPLEGLAAGLRAIGDRAPVAFATGVDAPLLHPALVRHVLRSLGSGDDVALPRAHGFAHPLAAAYRTATVAPLLAELLGQDRLATRDLLARGRARTLDEAVLLAGRAVAALDPALAWLANLNGPSEYEAARARSAPAVTVARGGAEPRVVRATMLAHAGTGAAIVDGRRVEDPQTPLVSGDRVRFLGR